MKPVLVITGGANGLGREIAASMTGRFEIILLDIDSKVLQKVASKLSCDFFVCDIANQSSVQLALKEIIRHYKRIDCLINSAGVYLQGQLTTNNPELIRQVIEVNTLGTINLCRFVSPQMKKQGYGTILNIVSQAALYPQESRSVYHASKWAIDGFTKSLQPELAPYGIKVMGVYPGLMKTKLLERAGYKRDMSSALDPEDIVSVIQFLITLPKHVVVPEVGVKHLDHY